MPQSEDRSFIQQADAAFKLAAMDVLRIARQTGTPVIVGDGDDFNAISPDEYEKVLVMREALCPESGRMAQDMGSRDESSFGVGAASPAEPNPAGEASPTAV